MWGAPSVCLVRIDPPHSECVGTEQPEEGSRQVVITPAYVTQGETKAQLGWIVSRGC